MQHTIKLKLGTKNRLKEFGEKDESFDELVNDLLDEVEELEDKDDLDDEDDDEDDD